MILGGCAANDGEVKPTLSTSERLVTLVSSGPTCSDSIPRVAHRVDETATFTFERESVTESCRCTATTHSSWGCSNAKHCTSEYDYGGPNPVRCSPVDVSSLPLGEVRAIVDRADCTAVVATKDERSIVTVTCTTAGAVDVLITAPATELEKRFFLFFTADGACPVEASGGNETDAGPASDAAPE